MIVQIRGAGFVNKGAELMLITVVNRLQEEFPSWQPVISFNMGAAEQRRALGLKDLYWMEEHKRRGVRLVYNGLLALNAARTSVDRDEEPSTPTTQAGIVSKIVQRIQRLNAVRTPDAVLGRDVDLVLDLSGFAYGDPWGARNTEAAASYYKQVKGRGGCVVLMPQQLGPFEDPDVRDAFRRLSGHCDLIFARERISYEIAKEIAANPEIVHQCPDFTVLQKGTSPEDPEIQGRACIVPNSKMLSQTRTEVSEAYPVFLSRCVGALRERHIEPVVLIHEQSGGDRKIADQLSHEAGGVRIIDEQDPLRIKGIIGVSLLTIGSRFHGLVSALSQAVPSLGTSWSHKYRMLFEEYGCSENLVDPALSDQQLVSALDRLLNESAREKLIGTLREHGRRNNNQVEEMWGMIHNHLNLRGWPR